MCCMLRKLLEMLLFAGVRSTRIACLLLMNIPWKSLGNTECAMRVPQQLLPRLCFFSKMGVEGGGGLIAPCLLFHLAPR